MEAIFDAIISPFGLLCIGVATIFLQLAYR